MKIAAVTAPGAMPAPGGPRAGDPDRAFRALLGAGTEPRDRPADADDVPPILPDAIAAPVPVPVQSPLASAPVEPGAASAASGSGGLPAGFAGREPPALFPPVRVAGTERIADTPEGPMGTTLPEGAGAALSPAGDLPLPEPLSHREPGPASAPPAGQGVRVAAAIVPQAPEAGSTHAPAAASPPLAALQRAAETGAVADHVLPQSGRQARTPWSSKPGTGSAARAPAAPVGAGESASRSGLTLPGTRAEDGPFRFPPVVAASPEGQFGPDWSDPPGLADGRLLEAPAAMSEVPADPLGPGGGPGGGQGGTAREEGALIQDVALAVTAADALDIRLTVRSEELARDLSAETGRLVADLASVGAKVDSIRVETPRALGTDGGADAAGGQRPGAGGRQEARQQEDVAVALRSGGHGSQGGQPLARPGDGGKVDRYA